MDEACFKVPYDILICAVGSDNNTFGIKVLEGHVPGRCALGCVRFMGMKLSCKAVNLCTDL